MSEIKRLPEAMSGVKDAVSLEAKCSYMRLMKEKVGQQVLNVTMMASWENGVLSLTYHVGKQKQMVSVRLDEVMELLHQASEAFKEAHEGDDVDNKQG